jgi:hypothetical protein
MGPRKANAHPSLTLVTRLTDPGFAFPHTLRQRRLMPILIMGLVALMVFFGIGGLLFAAGIAERRQFPEHSPLQAPTSASQRKIA